jgi:hypothetical protein
MSAGFGAKVGRHTLSAIFIGMRGGIMLGNGRNR